MQLRWVVLAALAGAGIGYLVDPRSGAGRRPRERMLSEARGVAHAVGHVGVEIQNHAQGTVATVRRKLDDEPVDDATLVQRVRAEMGHHIQHTHAVQVRAQDGHVILSGPILKHEAETLVKVTEGVPGVKSVESRLLVHDHPGNVPDLQSNTENNPS